MTMRNRYIVAVDVDREDDGGWRASWALRTEDAMGNPEPIAGGTVVSISKRGARNAALRQAAEAALEAP